MKCSKFRAMKALRDDGPLGRAECGPSVSPIAYVLDQGAAGRIGEGGGRKTSLPLLILINAFCFNRAMLH
jgi:hypothetical protein